ncbi:hypothetical protein D3C78_1608260 [compost metagenome]
MYFCTSLSLVPRMVASGFSWPSTALVSSAVYSSVNGIGTGLAPSAENISMYSGDCTTRTLRPAMSSIFTTGRTLLVRWRKPSSQ